MVDKLALEPLYRASRRAAADWLAGERDTDIGDSANTADSCVCAVCLAEGTRHDLVDARDVVDDTLVLLGLDDVLMTTCERRGQVVMGAYLEIRFNVVDTQSLVTITIDGQVYAYVPTRKLSELQLCLSSKKSH